MLQFKLTFVNADKFELALAAWRDSIEDWTRIWPKVADHLRAKTAQQFTSQGATGASGPWDGLSEPYRRRKLKRWGDRPILQASGKLLGAAVGGSEGHLENFEPLRMQFGVDAGVVPYAIYHQTGTSKMPARRILDLTEGDQVDIGQILLWESMAIARRLGFTVAQEPSQLRFRI